MEEVFYGGAAGGGKRLSIDTPIATPAGWTTMGDLQEGDSIFDDVGKVCRVVRAFPIEVSKRSYIVEFSDGTSVEADADHLWRTFTFAERARQLRHSEEWRAKRRSSRASRAKEQSLKPWVSVAITERNRNRVYESVPPEGCVRTTEEIANTLYVRGDIINHSIPLTGPLDLPDADLPVSPYLIGLWLGDGFSSSGCIGMADEDWQQLIGFVEEKCQSVRRHQPGNGRKKVFTVIRFWELTAKLRKLGILGSKRIPLIYQRASIEQRKELLRGLLDTDGHCSITGQIEIGLGDRLLAEDVNELLTGLGVKSVIKTKVIGGKSNGRDSHRMKFLADFRAFKLPRKAMIQKSKTTHSTASSRYIVAVRPISPRAMRCIAVDSTSHLFLAGKQMVPTHNSSWLLMEALKYVSVPRYAAIMFRKTLTDLMLPGALMDRAREWLHGTDAEWSEKEKTWHFPSSATITFAYLDNVKDHLRYRGSEFQCVCFDELTRFPEHQYLYLFSRVRRLAGSEVPIRVRSASNPGDIGHEWVKERFITAKNTDKRQFVPALLSDNPHIDKVTYRQSLQNLDPITRAQLEAGDWNAFAGGRFRREWFRQFYETDQTYDLFKRSPSGAWELVQSWPKDKCWLFVTCDPAASAKTTADYTAAGVWAVTPTKDLLLLEVIRKHLAVEEIIPELIALRQRHPRVHYMCIEDVAFQSMILAYARTTAELPAIRATEGKGLDKLNRATPAIIKAEHGQIYIPERAQWIDSFVQELVQFTGDDKKDPYDDQVDMVSFAALEIDRSGTAGYQHNPEEPEERRVIQPTHESNQSRRNLFGVGPGRRYPY